MAKLGNLVDFVSGRLTLTSGVPVTTADVIAAVTLYFTPYKGARIALYDTVSSNWKFYIFAERSISLSGLTADTNYDAYLYNNAGTLTLELVAWTDNTTRATALATQDGIYCKTGSLDRRYLGTIRITATIGQCEDSLTKRYVWNYYNRIRRSFYNFDSTASWTYTTATWRQSRATVANKVESVIGVVEDAIDLMFVQRIQAIAAGAFPVIGIGVNSTTTPTRQDSIVHVVSGAINIGVSVPTNLLGYISSLGYSYYACLEIGDGTNANVFYGAAANMILAGSVLA